MKFFWLLLIVWQLNTNVNGSSNRVIRQTGPPCVNPARLNGVCIPVRQCNSLMTMIREDGTDPNIINFLRKSKCGGNNKSPHVCCPDLSDNTESTTTESSKVTQPMTTVKPSSPSKIQEIKCGQSALESNRVVGGKDAALGNWPWMVGLSYRIKGAKSAPISFKCGATLISNQWVITAAHCLDDSALKELDLAYARLGDLNLDDNVNDGANPINAAIDKYILHPQYSTVIKQNDLALIRLKEPVEFTKNLHPICLLSGDKYKQDKYYAPKAPYIIGWGATGWLGKSANVLQEAQVKIFAPAKCAELYSKIKGALINEKVICAGEKGKDTCQGDSGGPLIFVDNKTFYLGGVVSYGIGCDTAVPGVYTKIAEYIDWINENTGENF